MLLNTLTVYHVFRLIMHIQLKINHLTNYTRSAHETSLELDSLNMAHKARGQYKKQNLCEPHGTVLEGKLNDTL